KIFLDSTKKLYIQAPRDKIEYEIYDIRGQLMISGKEKVANIRHLLPSIYFIKVFDEKNYYISKFIVR
ncbi:MAG: T9SS type A sorting domain-containing protein, partial [Muribaculaceae bacterium]|nr:T9SS type A sorting domain-containing protein [Muribaculaceae bacterium]